MPSYSLGKKRDENHQIRLVGPVPADWSDEQLMQALSEGRLACGGLLFERYHIALVNFFHRLCRRRDWSEDLAQITFERIIRYRHTYRADLPFRAWMYQIARTQLATYYKRHGREAEGIFGVEHRFGEEASVSRDIESREEKDSLKKALAALPEEYREILLLTRYQGMKYREAGQVLGISEGAVKVKVYRAIQQLKELYFKFDQA